MKDSTQLRDELEALDGNGYGAYKRVKGEWDMHGWTLEIQWIQGDPYAAPSRVRALVPAETAGLSDALIRSRSRRLGVASFLASAFDRVGEDAASGNPATRGSGRSGEFRIEAPGQEVLPQTAVQVSEGGTVEARFRIGLPARGRRIMGGAAAELVTGIVPRVVEAALLAESHSPEALLEAAEVNEDADHLRAALPELELLAFVADGARLPRRSGIDDRPLEGEGVVPFESPEPLRVEIDLPNRGTVRGMGIRRGVTLVVGGGFHGKSTVLRALERGVYNHRPGDGRELVVTEPGAVKIRAEDGRAVAGVDISPFIDGLPQDVDTRAFTTPNASGSTSQAAAIVEAMEAGATTLLVDEDTAATNFMIRDRRMQELVPGSAEPITPFVDRIRELADRGVSSVLVLGGSGDYLDVADTVIAMRDYVPEDATSRAQQVARAHPTGRRREEGRPFGPHPERVPDPAGVDPSKGRRDAWVRVRDGRLLFGREEIDVGAVEQIVSRAQLQAIGEALVLARRRFMDGETPLSGVLDEVMRAVETEGLDVLDDRASGELALFRRFELAATLNRLRGLRMTRRTSEP